MFTRFDKALAAAMGMWLANGAVIFFRNGLGFDVPQNVEAWFAAAITAGLVWLVPNRG